MVPYLMMKAIAESVYKSVIEPYNKSLDKTWLHHV
jgi:hypothetical protein